MGLEEELDALKRKRSSTKGRFTRKIKLLQEGIDRKDQCSVLKSNYEDVYSSFLALESKCDDVVNFLNENSYDQDKIDEADDYILNCERTKNLLHAQYMKIVEKSMQELDIGNLDKPKVKVKAFEPPRFSGNLRDFPSFKVDFDKLVKSSYGPDPYALKMCLSGEALQAVRGAEGDFKEMFERLNKKFGDTRKLVDAVLSEVKMLRKISEGDTKGFIKMVDVLEQSWLDLKNVNLSAELSTANVVTHIEKILPTVQRREWIIMSEEISDTSDLFPQLLAYLIREKRVLEYMSSNNKAVSNDNRATVHNVYSHQSCEDSEIIGIMKKMQEEQAMKNREFENCIVNLTELVKSANVRNNNKGERCLLHDTNNHDISSCNSFKYMTQKEKFEMIRNHGICFKCLKGYHLSRDCRDGKTCNVEMNNGNVCGRNHHPLLHNSEFEGTSHNATSVFRKGPRALLNISTVYCKNKPITVLWDGGSDVSLITHAAAKKLGLKGKRVNMSMIKVGNVTEDYTTKWYSLPLEDKAGYIWNVDVVGINEISARVDEVDVSKFTDLFIGVSTEEISRPSGNIDILIGTDYSELLPKVIQTNGNLQLLENQFGISIRGRHNSVDGLMGNVNHIVVRTHKLYSCVDLNQIRIEPTDEIKTRLENFFAVEGMGVRCDPNRKRCTCKECPGLNGLSFREEKELELIENGLIYDGESKSWTAHYPWLRDPMELRNNWRVAIARMKTTENRLLKLDVEYANKYQREIEDMIGRGAARKLTDKEINEYSGPIHYIHHHEVLKPDSLSTPLRIVFNSSAAYMGDRLNDFWAKGPDVLNSLLGVLLRFRQERVALVGDVSKMYHSVKISLKDQHTHRFVWRDLDRNKPIQQYALTSLTFGDRPSSVIATLAMRHTVKPFRSTHPEVFKMINNNTYVDDILHSTPSKENALKLIKDLEQILATGGFRIKHWIVSSHSENLDLNIMDSDSEKILGLKWNPKNDHFYFTVKLNFSPRVRKVRTGEDLKRDEIETNFPHFLTRRMLLSQISSLYDPLGLVLPATLKSKLLMRKLITNHETGKIVEWDTALDESIIGEWKQFFSDLYMLEDLTFDRCLKPVNAVGEPTLIIFSDASSLAYGACVYVRWKTDTDKYVSRLVVAKCRIAPLKQLSIPRLELCGALMAARLREFVEKELDWTFESIIHIVDSAIVRSQIQKESYGFNTFVATRIAEIQRLTSPNEWWWVSSDLNPADLLTKPCNSLKLDINSVWQNGPNFLTQPITDWPIKQNLEYELPDRIGITLLTEAVMENMSGMNVINVERFSDYSKLLKVTCRIKSVCTEKSLLSMFKTPTSDDMIAAEMLWVKEMQQGMSDWNVRYKRLGPYLKDGIIVVGQRISRWLKSNWNQDHFILIPADHVVTRLYITYLHNKDHAGIESTLAKLQTKFWVPGARKIIRSVKNECVSCRKLNKETESQCMGQVIDEKMKPAPPFYYCAVDLFGPLTIKDTVKGRSRCKVVGIIFNCLVTRAIYLDIAESYGTEHFLSTLQRFTCIRGFPKIMYSDNGTQLKAASKELERLTKDWNYKEICQFGCNEGMKWHFNKSSDAPWQNGSSESLIRLVKRGLCMTIGDSILTFGELQTTLFKIANMINERPIGLKPGSDLELGTYLSPNDLLLGRTNIKTPLGPYDVSDNPRKRIEFMQNIVDSFWKKWQRDYFPTLLVRQKWHVTRRNVRVGDIVLVQDSNAIRGTWKLAQVIEAEPGRDGNIRDVKLRYKLVKEGKVYKGAEDKIMNRSVHRLVVILPVEEQSV